MKKSGSTNEAVRRLLEDGKCQLLTNMGSCQCGDTRAKIWLAADGELLASSTGRMGWQTKSQQPALTFPDVSYGMGATIRTVACAYLGMPTEADDQFWAWSSGTRLS